MKLLLLPRVALSLFFAGTVLSLMAARQAVGEAETFHSEIAQVAVTPPDTPPEQNQESIDAALAMFHITVPGHVEHPRFDPLIEDRGLTTMRGFGKKLEVTVGPGAFASWALLGSTLAHEIEIHCQQNFTMIRLLDMLGLKGTDTAEREAYAHELAGSRRFNLSPEDQESIHQTMEFYYPESPETTSGFSQEVVNLLARTRNEANRATK